MEISMVLRALLTLALLPGVLAASGSQIPSDPITELVGQLEQAGSAGDTAAIVALGVTPDAPGLRSFISSIPLQPTRFVVKERDRAAQGTARERLLLEVFVEFGREAVIATWRVEIVADAPAGSRRIEEMERLTMVSGLYRLELNPAKQFTIRNLSVRAPDLTLDMASGRAFVAEVDDGPTAVVLIGRGRMRFAPSDAAERSQMELFADEEVLTADFDAAFLRVRPADFARTFGESALTATPVRSGDFRRASRVFDDYVGQTLQLDLHDLSRDRWSLIPMPGDFIAEVRTRRNGHLTYARSWREAEDITLFDRRRRRNISLYASPEKLEARGRFYDEDDLVEYDVQHYDIDAAFVPERLWLDGVASLRVKARNDSLTSLTLRLADPLTVRAIVSPELGRLLHLRVVGQNAVIVNLPTAMMAGVEFTLNVVYSGRLEPQRIEGEGATVQAQEVYAHEQIVIPIEPQYIYSNRSYWYPQATVSDYATAELRITVPDDVQVVASGEIQGPSIPAPESFAQGSRRGRMFLFSAREPVRYLSCIISRFTEVSSGTVPGAVEASVAADQPAAVPGPSSPAGAAGTDPRQPAPLTLTVQANPRQSGRGRSLAEDAAAMLAFFRRTIGDAPYPSFTVAVTEDELPGGHSPAYFAVVNQPLPLMPLGWRNDPVAFDGYPPYFLAHEVAHQWWGQAVGWKNYHEQWLSEGFSQYFAVLYAAEDRGPDQLTSMLRHMRKWSIDKSDQGPIYLGYRLGHIKGDSRVFRAVVYNKGAMVLHMLRRLIGDGPFFAGVRDFYETWKFRKAGTDDLRAAMERASGHDLAAFFEGWIYGQAIPELRFDATVRGEAAVLVFEHAAAVIPIPVTVSIRYSDGRTEDVVVPVTQRKVSRTVPLSGPVRSFDVNRDYAAVAEIDD